MHPRFLLALLLVLGLTGCNKGGDDALFGKWSFDHDYTQAHLPKELIKSPNAPLLNDPFPKGFPSDAKAIPGALKEMRDNTLKPSLTEALIAQLDGTTFTISPKLFTDVIGQAQTYQIVERPNPGAWSIKTADGKIDTYTLEDGRLSSPTTGAARFNVYYKRVNQ